MKVALVYDHINKFGGAERILLALHELFPEAPLYTLVYDAKKAEWAKCFNIQTSFVQKIPFAKSYHEFFPVLPVFAMENFRFNEYDAVISITSAEAKGIITSPDTFHFCYCLTPTRYLWSHYQQYFSNRLLKFISPPIVSWLRVWDIVAAQRPDVMVGISETVRERIRKYYRTEAKVIYPPVDIRKLSAVSKQPTELRNPSFFLIVSRLVRYKRIDIAVEACNQLKLPLIIIGSGFERGALEIIAGPTVKLLGNLTEDELIGYYQNCRALIFSQEEDFGITAVEALACGKPVIAFGKGGVKEIVKPGVTGELFPDQTSEALIKILRNFQEQKYSAKFCRQGAEKFSKERFKKEFYKIFEKKYDEYKNKNINIT